MVKCKRGIQKKYIIRNKIKYAKKLFSRAFTNFSKIILNRLIKKNVLSFLFYLHKKS